MTCDYKRCNATVQERRDHTKQVSPCTFLIIFLKTYQMVVGEFHWGFDWFLRLQARLKCLMVGSCFSKLSLPPNPESFQANLFSFSLFCYNISYNSNSVNRVCFYIWIGEMPFQLPLEDQADRFPFNTTEIRTSSDVALAPNSIPIRILRTNWGIN